MAVTLTGVTGFTNVNSGNYLAPSSGRFCEET